MKRPLGEAVQASIDALPECLRSAIAGREPFCIASDHVEFSLPANNGAPLSLSIGVGGWAILGREAWFESNPSMVRHIEPVVMRRRAILPGALASLSTSHAGSRTAELKFA